MKLQNIGKVIFILCLQIYNIEIFSGVIAQDPLFELPVQLIGFPVIILSVKLSNFAKKLSYSLNLDTYKTRTRRSIGSITDQQAYPHGVDITYAIDKIKKEFGPKACVILEPCETYATKQDQYAQNYNWNDILRNYKVQSIDMREWYLLSVFLGDFMKDIQLCRQLASRLKC